MGICTVFLEAIDQIKKFHFLCPMLCCLNVAVLPHQPPLLLGDANPSTSHPGCQHPHLLFKVLTWSLVLREKQSKVLILTGPTNGRGLSPVSYKRALCPKSTVSESNMPIWAQIQRHGPGCLSPHPQPRGPDNPWRLGQGIPPQGLLTDSPGVGDKPGGQGGFWKPQPR